MTSPLPSPVLSQPLPRRKSAGALRLAHVVAGLVTAGLLMVSLAGGWEALELRAAGAAFQIRGPRPPGAPLAIAAVDDYSFALNMLPWPWPRTYLAQLIDRLAAGGARGIAVDVFLLDPEDFGKGTTYTVRGETLAEIAAQAGVSLAALVEANGLDPANTRVCAGQGLVIPTSPPAAHRFTVDALADIAARFQLSPEVVMAANRLTDPCELTARQLLRLPVLSTTVTYTVQPGDTVTGVAALFQVNPLAIASPDGQPVYDPLAIGQSVRVLLGDAALAASIRAAGNVVLIGKIEALGPGLERLAAPLPELGAGQAGWGLANIGLAADGAVHGLLAWQRAAVDDRVYYAWPLVAAALQAGQPLAAAPSRQAFALGAAAVPLEAGELRLNYIGPPGSLPAYHAADIVSGDVAPETFRGQLVFVGATTESLHDLYPTPWGAAMPGVEIMAQAADTVLSGQFMYAWSGVGGRRWMALVAVLAACLAAWGLLQLRRPVVAVAALLGLMAAYASAWLAAFLAWRVELPLAAPEISLVLAYALPTVERAISEEREKQRVRAIFELFISPEMVKQLVAQGIDAMRGRRCELTILFSDIRGFTTLSEKLTPEALVELLNEYLGVMTAVIHHHGGTVDKYEGDLVMAFFGAPLPQADHAQRAVLAAIEMRQALDRLRAKWQAEGKTSTLEMGIGLNSGEVFVGLLGSDKRVNYTVMGDAVNLASRLQDLTKEFAWPLLISEYTYALVKDTFDAEFAEARQVKGKTVRVGIYRVLGRKGAPESERLRPLFS